jgi:hypothetical protein
MYLSAFLQLENLAITVGRLAKVCPGILAPACKELLHPWCLALQVSGHSTSTQRL